MRLRFWNALAVAGALFFFAAAAAAQTQTNVTATIVDPLGIPYANGTYSIQLIPAGTNPTVNGNSIGGAFNGRLDANGSFNVSLWPNGSIVPGGTQWQFTICSNSGGIQPPLGTGGQCTPPTAVTISGASQNLSSTLSAVAPRLTTITIGGGSVTSVGGTAPIVATPNPITGVGTISCPTCTTGTPVTGCTVTGGVAFENGTPNSLGCNAALVFDGTSKLSIANANNFIQPNTATGLTVFRASNGAAGSYQFTADSLGLLLYGMNSTDHCTTTNAVLTFSGSGDIICTNVFTDDGVTLTYTGTGGEKIGTDNVVAGTMTVANGAANAHTTFGSAATTSNTINGPAVVIPTGDLVSCTTSGTTCTLTDAGAPGTTATNCISSASPAVCGSARAGLVTIAAAATTVVVNTTAVTANSEILIQFDSSLGTALGVTCNATVDLGQLTARSVGTSFTITGAAAPAVNPACYSYLVVN